MRVCFSGVKLCASKSFLLSRPCRSIDQWLSEQECRRMQSESVLLQRKVFKITSQQAVKLNKSWTLTGVASSGSLWVQGLSDDRTAGGGGARLFLCVSYQRKKCLNSFTSTDIEFESKQIMTEKSSTKLSRNKLRKISYPGFQKSRCHHTYALFSLCSNEFRIPDLQKATTATASLPWKKIVKVTTNQKRT